MAQVRGIAFVIAFMILGTLCISMPCRISLKEGFSGAVQIYLISKFM